MPYQLGNLTIYYIGEDGSGTVSRSGGVQNYQEIQAQLLASGKLFEDPEFVLSSSLFEKENEKLVTDCSWLRPQEIQKQYFKSASQVVFKAQESGDDEEFCRLDVRQGGIGDCGFMASTATALTDESVTKILFPEEGNSFESGEYTGLFHFRVCWMGRWLDVVVDDRLPVHMDGRPIGCKAIDSCSKAEYWPCLIEKLWGKLANTFDGQWMGGGIKHVHALTGGIYEDYPTREPNSFEEIKMFAEREGVFGLTSWPKERPASESAIEGHTEKQENLGLVSGHAYSLTGVEEVETLDGKVVQLVRWRNPWGSHEWTGDWSDESPLWKTVSKETKDRLGLAVRNDGEFWMSFDDFKARRATFELTHLIPQELDSDRELLGKYVKYHGKWSQEHVDNWGKVIHASGGHYFFSVDKPNTRTLIGFMAFGTNYGAPPSTDIKAGYRVYRVGEPGISDEEATKGIASVDRGKPLATSRQQYLGNDFEPKAFNLDAGTYAVSIYVKAMQNPPYDEFLLRIYWGYN